MAFERPLIEKLNPTLSEPSIQRAIVSPCTECQNNIPVGGTPEEMDQMVDINCELGHPCPKKALYSLKKQSDASNSKLMNFDNAVFDEDLLAVNPVWPGLAKDGNAYGYLWVATYDDNKNSGYNTNWDTKYIHCRGPALIRLTERMWHLAGHIEQGDELLVIRLKFSIDGIDFYGLAEEAQIWQTSQGYGREVDRNLGKSFSANGEL